MKLSKGFESPTLNQLEALYGAQLETMHPEDLAVIIYVLSNRALGLFQHVGTGRLDTAFEEVAEPCRSQKPLLKILRELDAEIDEPKQAISLIAELSQVYR